MLEDVVASTAELEVLKICVAVLEPVDDVMPVAEAAGEVAAVFAAGAVADLQGASLRGGDQPGAPAEVEDL